MSAAAEQEIFRRRTAIGLAILCSVSLLAALILSALSGDVAEAPTAEPSAYSRSAIGYQGLVRLLDAAGVPVTVSRNGSALKAGPDRPLLIADPPSGVAVAPLPEDADDPAPHREPVKALVTAAVLRRALVIMVLPKWTGRPMRLDAGWVERVDLRPANDASEALAEALGEPCPTDAILRPAPRLGGFRSVLDGAALPTLPRPQLLREGTLGVTPLVWSDDGVLVGTFRGGEILVITDPDLLNNSGLGQGDNAVVVHRVLVDRSRAAGLVMDETIHGFGRSPSLWGELFQFPLVLVPLHLAGLLALLLAATIGRFGKPEPLPPRLSPGKLSLVDNTAELLGLGGFTARSLRHYAEATLREGAAACALPQGLDEQEQVARLAEVARQRGLSLDVTALHAEAAALDREGARRRRGDGRKILDIARALYRWRQEITRGR